MAKTNLQPTIENVDPTDVIAYLTFISNRIGIFRKPQALDDIKFKAVHNQLCIDMAKVIAPGDAAVYISNPILVPVIPSNLVISAPATNGATAAWDAMPGATGYNVQYRKAKNEPWISVQVLGAATTALAGLVAASAYEVQVQSIYPTGLSEFSKSQNFNTAAAAGA